MGPRWPTGRFAGCLPAALPTSAARPPVPTSAGPLATAADRLNAASVQLRGTVDGIPYDVTLDGAQLVSWLDGGIYAGYLAGLPRAIDSAARGVT